MNKFGSMGILASAVLLLPASVQAADLFVASPSAAGNHYFSGTYGLDFEVLQAVTVTSLGVFDADRNGIAGAVSAAVFQNGAAVSPQVSFAGAGAAGAAGYTYRMIAPLTLQPGIYQIAAWGFSSTDQAYNSNAGPGGTISFTANPALRFLGASYSTGAGAAGSIADPVGTRYGAGSLQFATLSAAVPEPASWLMMVAGLALVGVGLRRRPACQPRRAAGC